MKKSILSLAVCAACLLPISQSQLWFGSMFAGPASMSVWSTGAVLTVIGLMTPGINLTWSLGIALEEDVQQLKGATIDLNADLNANVQAGVLTAEEAQKISAEMKHLHAQGKAIVLTKQGVEEALDIEGSQTRAFEKISQQTKCTVTTFNTLPLNWESNESASFVCFWNVARLLRVKPHTPIQSVWSPFWETRKQIITSNIKRAPSPTA